MAAGEASSILVCDITSCSICLETFKDPKVLPCIHTLCFQCLDKYCEDKDPGEETTCPLCRQVFLIPLGGIQDLPGNFFIQQLLQVNKPIDTEETLESDEPMLCELCSDSEAQVPATCYCTECDQHICQRCAIVHKRLKVSMQHQVLRGKNIRGSRKKLQLTTRYCDQHSNEQNRLYCYDCKMVMISVPGVLASTTNTN